MVKRLMTLLLILSILLLSACRAPWDDAKAKQAEADTRLMMQSLVAPDLQQYRERTLPPKQLAQIKKNWPLVRKQFELNKSEQASFNKLLNRFIEDKAERHLLRDLNAKIKPLSHEIDNKWPLMQTSLDLLLQGWIESSEQLSKAEKAHGRALVAAIIAQMPAEWLQNKVMREQAFAQMVAIARALEIENYQDYNNFDYVQFNDKLAQFIAGLKKLGLIYGLDWNASQSRLEVKVLEQSGNKAKVQIRYPLGQKWVEFDMDLIEQDGHWYDASALALFNSIRLSQ
ncbi:MAG TPA: hypothetical protein VN247_05950 [Arenimonas sp.]|nr:hypothetical protein [Arenimonas sp.]